MTIGIMQPYFLPYIGYWQLMTAVDAFIVYDNIQYTKKGWINRNRFLQNGAPALFTIPLKHDSDTLDICSRSIAEEFRPEKLISKFEASYRKAPLFGDVFPIVTSIVAAESTNLFTYVAHSIQAVSQYLDIRTPLVVSSTVPVNHSLRGQDKVIRLCGAMGGDRYINAIGGQQLYSKTAFADRGIRLNFLQTRPVSYRQFGNEFVPNLSILDVMMFNEKRAIKAMLGEFDLI